MVHDDDDYEGDYFGGKYKYILGLPRCCHGKNLSANAGAKGDMRFNLGLGRSPGGRHGNPLQYSCQNNPMDRGAWKAIGHGASKSQTQLK